MSTYDLPPRGLDTYKLDKRTPPQWAIDAVLRNRPELRTGLSDDMNDVYRLALELYHRTNDRKA